MGSRVRCRKTVKNLFEVYMIVEPPWTHSSSSGSGCPSLIRSPSDRPNELTPIVRSIFPSSNKDQDLLKTAAQFAFPCPTQSETVELFTFVLTGGDSKWTFGYCRHPPGAQMCSLFLSFLPWQEIFYRTLNFCAEIDDVALVNFLEKMYTNPVPDAGTCLYIPIINSKPFICPCPSDHALASIPENRNVSEFYNALSTESIVTLFSALLSERRIVVTSKKLSRLSSIVIACNLFLFPMSWQHIFIPVLPTQLQDYLAAPMPFLIGVPLPVWDRIPSESLGQVVRVDADTNTVTTPFPEDVECMPNDIVTLLRKNLTVERVVGDGLSRAFLRALAQLMGHYQDAVRDEGESFDSDLFIQFAHPSHRSFIESKLLLLQIFQQFIEERLERVKAGSCESDEFELESLAWRSSRANGKNGIPVFKSIAGSQNRMAIKKAGKAVIMRVKCESGNLIETVKQNSTLKSAIRSMKEGGKNVKQRGHGAYSDIRAKFQVSTPAGRGIAEYGHTQTTKTYRRHSGAVAHGQKHNTEDSNFGRASTHMTHTSMRNSDDNLVHLMSSSTSRSNMGDITCMKDGDKLRVQPRLSKSEENLIDLDTPDSLQGFTLENPLYDLVKDDSVFEDTLKSDDQLLTEYGLNDYFARLNVNGASLCSSTSGSGTIQPSSTSSATSSATWTTFE